MSMIVDRHVNAEGKRVAVIRTSDSITFRSCRRKWDWSSHLRDNLEPLQHANPLWLGSGMHFALEDFHGHKLYGTATKALHAFAAAFKAKYPKKIPDDWKELLALGSGMMDYYPVWLSNRSPMKTYIFNGVPQLEVGIKIPIDMKLLKGWEKIAEHWDEVIYSLTLDRVVLDEEGQLWIMEYKSAKTMIMQHFQTDSQCGRYIWAADLAYDIPVAGVIYQQHKKAIPNEARILQNGTISSASNQATTRTVYRKALMDMYGDPSKFPPANVECLNAMALKEDESGDAFIKRSRIHRNKKSSESEAQKILLEVADMLNPDLSIYPNPTRDCPNWCPFLSPCISRDDGSDYKQQLRESFQPRAAEYDEWRTHLPDPETFELIKIT